MDKDDLQRQCESLSNQELFTVVSNKIRYTEQIVRAAQIEIRNRALSKEEIKKHKDQQVRQAKVITGNIVDDLSLGEKIVFFFLFLPRINYFIKRDYVKQNYILKLRQAGYYSLIGFVFFFISMALSGTYRISLVTSIIIWTLSFLPAYALDRYFITQKIIKWLAIRSANPKQKDKN